MVAVASIWPRGCLVRQAVEVQVPVLVAVGETLVGIGVRRRRHAVDHHGPRSLLVAETVGVLTQRAAVRVIGRAGLRAVGPLCLGVLADGRGVTRALTDLAGTFRSAHAGVVVTVVDEGLAVREALRERVLVLQRAADLGVPDLLLHQHAALERGPRDPVVGRRGVVLRVERVRGAVAGADVGVHETIARTGRHVTGLVSGQIPDGCREPLRRIGDRDLEYVTLVYQQRVVIRQERADVRELRARRTRGDAVGLQEREVGRLLAIGVAGGEVEVALQAVDGEGRAPLGHAAALAVDKRGEARRVQLELHERGAGRVGDVQADIAVAVRGTRVLRIGIGVAHRQPKPRGDGQLPVVGDASGRGRSALRVHWDLRQVRHRVT